ncbi:hypothetical protein EMIHUDRAFT_201086 [Emiliania huxleyi CCMP1516]|uniref:Uncharacterized protein n=2 Tax=Emiliania huxleyi TaxID=2903 RepID=A0A0D3KM47_EMIH1|nr:hypothetical protein EMIHUDRAFT_201086 [Emiliania huxleyi CCMP1516]EOD36832.1 hypothetical protein EMIHUDRAFT_201086 [Emiliania huxleyi CCMP1516]|eukprot:XP_005789261.1 hypothetical protein EMIHUDRAFT_201086 [Emiliania huxleyi CCMP1516]
MASARALQLIAAFAVTPCAALVLPGSRLLSPSARHSPACASDAAPVDASLRQQMKAYLDHCRATGRELTSEQKAMIAEIEKDEALLDQTGFVDFSKRMRRPLSLSGCRDAQQCCACEATSRWHAGSLAGSYAYRVFFPASFSSVYVPNTKIKR